MVRTKDRGRSFEPVGFAALGVGEVLGEGLLEGEAVGEVVGGQLAQRSARPTGPNSR